MVTTVLPARRESGRTRLIGFWWLLLSAVAITALALQPYLGTSLERLTAEGNAIAGGYAARPGWAQVAFYVHIVFGGLALLVSPLQLAARVRARLPLLHRAVGRVAVFSMIVGGVAGLVIAPMNQAGPIGAAGFGTLAVLWVWFAVAAVMAARRRDFASHRRWAVRGFAMTYAAVTLRLWLGVMMVTLIAGLGMDPEQAFPTAYAVMPFLCWVPNLLVVEFVLRRRAA